MAHKELIHLYEQVAKLAHERKIKLSDAILLAHLPKDEQLDFIDQAMAAREFYTALRARVKAVRKNR